MCAAGVALVPNKTIKTIAGRQCVQPPAALVINALDVFARGHFLKAVGIGIDQRIREIVRYGPMSVQVSVTNDRAVQQIIVKRLKLPLLGILTPLKRGKLLIRRGLATPHLCQRLSGCLLALLRVGMDLRQRHILVDLVTVEHGNDGGLRSLREFLRETDDV